MSFGKTQSPNSGKIGTIRYFTLCTGYALLNMMQVETWETGKYQRDSEDKEEVWLRSDRFRFIPGFWMMVLLASFYFYTC